MSFETELRNLINCHSIENESDTPDFILAHYILNCLLAFAEAIQEREKWYGREKKPIESIETPNKSLNPTKTEGDLQ
jgi:hypothetical protein